MDIAELLAFSVKNKASDLHLSSGLPPMIRVDGDVRRINIPALDHKQVHALIYDIMSDKQRRDYEEFLECDFSFEIPGLARFRVNAFNQNRGAGAVFRTVPSEVLTLEDLGTPRIFKELIDQPQGLILVTGPTGSGKSTTLAAMVDHINKNEYGHILTIEDPIEYLHRHKKSIVNQREVGLDTHAFHNALKNAMREAPDVILIGEILDATTMEAAIAFAETGHICLATLHSNNADQTIERILNFFPEAAHKNVLMNLALNLRSVVSQRLVVGKDGRRMPATEVLINTPMIRDLLRRGQIHEVKQAMEESLEEGMESFDQCLFRLYKEGRIERETALRAADSRDGLDLKFRLSEGGSGEHDPYADVFESTGAQR
jgi:twitching motility protein PilU